MERADLVAMITFNLLHHIKVEEMLGLAERVASCYENPAHADKHIKEWRKDSQKATEETMAPYMKAIDNTCQQIIESKEISNNIFWEEVLGRVLISFCKKTAEIIFEFYLPPCVILSCSWTG